jgi:glycosyltransferase involved in cell wall biosynthesis
MKMWLLEKVILEVLQNWLAVNNSKTCRILIGKTKLKGRKIFVYVGNMGVAQGLSVFIELADSLSTKKSIGFLFVGRGDEKKSLRQAVKARGSDNILIYDEIEPQEIHALYQQCDVGIISLDKRHKTQNIPGKFLSYMQSGLPVLAAISSCNDLENIIKSNKVGCVSTNHSVEVLKKLVEEILENVLSDDGTKNRSLKLYKVMFSPKKAIEQIINGFHYIESREQVSNYLQKDIQSLPLVSLITVVYNNAQYIKDSIQSVLSQDYARLEYIVIDGGSNDGTVEIIEEYRDQISVFVSEPDKGIYDALNKGILHASGEVVGILHSGDLFCNEFVVSASIQQMRNTSSEFCFSDMVVVDNISGKIVRYYMAHYFRRWMFRIGWLPPHPTTFIKKSLFDEFGLYSTKYKISGDYDFFVRIFFAREIKWTYLNLVSVKMRMGGASNSGFTSKKLIFDEINRSLKSNQVWSLSIFQLGRYLIRMFELVMRPRKGDYGDKLI